MSRQVGWFPEAVFNLATPSAVSSSALQGSAHPTARQRKAGGDQWADMRRAKKQTLQGPEFHYTVQYSILYVKLNPGILPNTVHKLKTRDGERTLFNPRNKKSFKKKLNALTHNKYFCISFFCISRLLYILYM